MTLTVSVCPLRSYLQRFENHHGRCVGFAEAKRFYRDSVVGEIIKQCMSVRFQNAKSLSSSAVNQLDRHFPSLYSKIASQDSVFVLGFLFYGD